MKGKTLRIGLMGETAQKRNVLLFLAALECRLAVQGVTVNADTEITAANAAYES